jgi:hypothetical protein
MLMAEQRRNNDIARRDDGTTDPKNPPDAVLNKTARRAAVWSYFVPIVVLFVVIGVALVYWSLRAPHSEAADRTEVGTVGRPDGGFDPKPRPDTPRDEIKFRGSDLEPITRISALREANVFSMAGRRVELQGLKVESASGNVLWVRDDDRKYAIVTPGTTASVKAGATISVRGRVEPDEQGEARIVADQLEVT